MVELSMKDAARGMEQIAELNIALPCCHTEGGHKLAMKGPEWSHKPRAILRIKLEETRLNLVSVITQCREFAIYNLKSVIIRLGSSRIDGSDRKFKLLPIGALAFE